jgi:hypothetical protein
MFPKVSNFGVMAALTACRCNQTIRRLAKRLQEVGKSFQVMTTACIGMLLIILNTILKTDCPWTALSALQNS